MAILFRSASVARRLSGASPLVFATLAGLAAFTAYCCVYAFRKPFTAATYSGLTLWGMQFKIALVLAQVAGYALSKFIGIRVIAAMGAAQRAVMLLGVIGVAAIALLGFALTPAPWNVGWMFLNGLPLGMAWGLIFSYLEGRRVTEVLAAALCTNFILSSGFVKTVGKWLLDVQGVSEMWMPFVAGLLFMPLLLVCIWLLEHLPPPDDRDRHQRAERVSMTSAERSALFRRYRPGLLALVAAYLVLTIVRDLRDNFAVEIWAELGFGGQPAILTTAELPVAALCLVIVSGMMLVRGNFSALWLNHALTLAGALLLAGSTWLFQKGQVSPILWMVTSGFGLFLPYILFNGVLFDRLMAAFRERGNVGYLMYIADSIGYLGSVAVLLWRNFGAAQISWLSFFIGLCYIGAGLIAVSTGTSWMYFGKKRSRPVDHSNTIFHAEASDQPLPFTSISSTKT